MNRVYRIAISRPYNGGRVYRHVALRARENGAALAHAPGRVQEDVFRLAADLVEIVETYPSTYFNQIVEACNKFNAQARADERPPAVHTASMMTPRDGALA